MLQFLLDELYVFIINVAILRKYVIEQTLLMA